MDDPMTGEEGGKGGGREEPLTEFPAQLELCTVDLSKIHRSRAIGPENLRYATSMPMDFREGQFDEPE